MSIVADLHLHSAFARACSKELNFENLTTWAKYKGINLLSSADFTHPVWFAETKQKLTEIGNGFYSFNGVDFVLGGEVSVIYSQGGKLRRVHLLLYAPDFETVEKINKELGKRGKLGSDGRPILGLTSQNIAQIMFEANPDSLIIPAHCLLGESFIHTKNGIKQLRDIQVGELVYTHRNRTQPVTEVLKRSFKGDLYHVRPWYFSQGLATTPEHPFYALKVEKCPTTGDRCLPSIAHKRVCKHKRYLTYRPEWIQSKDLQVGDVLVYPRFQNTSPIPMIPIAEGQKYKFTNGYLQTGGSRGRSFKEFVTIDKNFCRLLGYYLAEGYTNGRDEVGFTFHEAEQEYVSDVINLMRLVFGIGYSRTYRRPSGKGVEISFYSKMLVEFFTKSFYVDKPFRATTKTLPDWLLHLPLDHQGELLRGWWRGDKGSTSSRHLAQTMKVICLRLGIIPSIVVDSSKNHLNRGKHTYKSRAIKASADNYIFSNLAFYEDKLGLLSDAVFKKSITRLSRKHGWLDENYVYIPIRQIDKIEYEGDVYNLEVATDNSYVAEYATVHNCWTPWFGMYGANSGFDSLEECFGEYADKILAVETGLSSDPFMNWQIAELDKRSIVSFSDAHSLPKMGRELTMFTSPPAGGGGYSWLVDALKHQKIDYTLEFYPEEGKYHYTGHRNCAIRQTPEETLRDGDTCSVCKRKLTGGVLHRVNQLAKRTEADLKIKKAGIFKSSVSFPRPPYTNLVSLVEIIAEALGKPVASPKVKEEFFKLVREVSNELTLLTQFSLEEISKVTHPRIAEGIGKVRSGDIVIDPGYDGLYGIVKIWPETKKKLKMDNGQLKKKKKNSGQMGLF